ncbi:MAG TPA: response regulator [Thermoanaerobaculia bacterium]|jgi:CheY-like chemotaxis protein|nr:response regulator [Thermoanaerobaculia bacterium]
MTEDRTVLVVDDDDAIRTLIARVLLRADYDVAQAGNGSEALTKLRARRFQTVVLDLMMPVMSGFELVEYLGNNDDAGAPCIVVVSAAGERDLHSIHSPLVRSVLRKPFDLPELLAAVEKCARPE